MRVAQVAPGPAGHGVVRHAVRVADLLREAGAEVVLQHTLGPVPDVDVVHLHFTDSLLPGGIAAVAAQVAAAVSALSAPVVVTLHDVPGTDPDPARDARRAAGYAQVARAAQVVVVSSEREWAFWPEASVVPLPIEPLAAPGPVPAWADRPSLVVLGFVYPGKGHDVAVALAPPGSRVVAAGAVSPGCAELVDAFAERAAARGIDWLVTGELSEGDLHAAVRAATVPLAAYRTPGTSASLATWLAAGRRPIVEPSPQVDDLLRQEPDSVLPVPHGRLGQAVVDAFAAPGSTWLARPVARPAVAARHLAVYEAALRRATAGAGR